MNNIAPHPRRNMRPEPLGANREFRKLQPATIMTFLPRSAQNIILLILRESLQQRALINLTLRRIHKYQLQIRLPTHKPGRRSHAPPEERFVVVLGETDEVAFLDAPCYGRGVEVGFPVDADLVIMTGT